MDFFTNMPELLSPYTLQHEIDPPTFDSIICTLSLGQEAEHWRNPTLYNPSVFIDEGTLLARLEEFDNETSSTVVVCKLRNDGTLELVEDAPQLLDMQDPYYLGSFIDPADPEGPPYKVVGGVKITVDPLTGEFTNWQDENYRYKSDISEIVHDGQPVPFLRSTPYSKDLRYTQLTEGIAVCPRPQGAFGGLGRVGFFMSENILTLEADLHDYFARADESTLIPDIFEDNEWGGFNQLIPLESGEILVIGHKACRVTRGDDQILQYRPFSAILDPRSGKLTTPIQMLDVDPADFEYVLSKRPELDDVIFISGIQFLKDPSKAMFIGGVKDAAIGMKVIANPLLSHDF